MFHRRFGEAGLPQHSINVKMQGSAGQSFCAFMTKGIHVTLEGDANDYVGKVNTSLQIYNVLTLSISVEFETNMIYVEDK